MPNIALSIAEAGESQLSKYIAIEPVGKGSKGNA